MTRFTFCIVLLLVTSSSQFVRAQPDSCLKLLQTPVALENNPDSVKADSCLSSPTYGDLYAKQLFYVRFLYNVLPTPSGPEDTIIERTWQDIDTNYPHIRSAFDSIEQTYGGFILRRTSPSFEDTSMLGAHAFSINFTNYVNIDSITRRLSNIPMLDTSGYRMRIVYLAGVEIHSAPSLGRVVYSRGKALPRILVERAGNTPIAVFDVVGRPIAQFSYVNADQMRLLPDGCYFVTTPQARIVVWICD